MDVMSRMFFGDILGAEVFAVVSVATDVWCLGFQFRGIYRTVIIVSAWIRWRWGISRTQSIEQTIKVACANEADVADFYRMV